MTIRNPSEMQRLYEERDALLSELKAAWPKAQKEGILRQIREIENILDISSIPYNSERFRDSAIK